MTRKELTDSGSLPTFICLPKCIMNIFAAIEHTKMNISEAILKILFEMNIDSNVYCTDNNSTFFHLVVPHF